ncbi:unnamed protein product [Mycena citricolor]|uniref:GH16 domain-containing protein n=1 Tax=Mycena citricolor TaxID=2018698 RepID=A0AAD2JUF5_9AGAR|nr:unnamed protein product [Mycena citricolor]
MASEPSSPRTPTHPETHQMLPLSPTQATPFLSEVGGTSTQASRSSSFVSSPLNPSSPTTPGASTPPYPTRHASSSRPTSRGSSMNFGRFAASPDETGVMGPGPYPFSRESMLNGTASSRGSMVLYRLADESDRASLLVPPRPMGGAGHRNSIASFASTSTMATDSKYPSDHQSTRGLVPYAYDPAADELDPLDDEDLVLDPAHGTKMKDGYQSPRSSKQHRHSFPWRGIANLGMLILVILALLALFISYPVISYVRNSPLIRLLDSNARVNGTGQVAVQPNMPQLVDPDTPKSAHTRTGFDGKPYTLVFSDEFNADGRTFYPGDDPYWEAVDLWYGNTNDLEWYDPSQIVTRDGSLIITMDSTSTTDPRQSVGSTAPFTVEENHNQTYRSGMLQSWNKMCFTRGYMEVSLTLPGPNANAAGYWPGVWTMGNLARPGYTASTDGTWPYTYSTCDLGTFPNQTLADKSGPPAALNCPACSGKYKFELSWLSGQKLSACSCPGSDHPGPDVTVGRGAPEIDILEAERNKIAVAGQVVSQSAQFAPFNANYQYVNTTTASWQVFNSSISRANNYRGSGVQQAVSGLTEVPGTGFQGSGADFITYGFEYWSDPKDPSTGFITWQVNGTESISMGASAVGPDVDSKIGQRLIPVEPMSLILNLGTSPNWGTPDLTTMVFPAEMRVDYVRIYQRDGETNLGCDPKDYPTKDYIDRHMVAFTNPNLTTWQWDKPRNSLYHGGC